MQSGSDEAVHAYMRQHGLSFPVVNDPDGAISQTLGVGVTPTIAIVADGGSWCTGEVGIHNWPLVVCPSNKPDSATSLVHSNAGSSLSGFFASYDLHLF